VRSRSESQKGREKGREKGKRQTQEFADGRIEEIDLRLEGKRIGGAKTLEDLKRKLLDGFGFDARIEQLHKSRNHQTQES